MKQADWARRNFQGALATMDGAAWCMVGGTGPIAALFNQGAYEWPRTRATLNLALQGYVVKSRSQPSLGTLDKEIEL